MHHKLREKEVQKYEIGQRVAAGGRHALQELQRVIRETVDYIDTDIWVHMMLQIRIILQLIFIDIQLERWKML